MKKPLIISATPTDDLLALRNRARSARRVEPSRAVVIELAGGTYRLSKTLELSSADSGVTWRSRGGERAVISGGVPITGWRADTVNGKPCWVTEVERGWDFTHLWVAGSRRSWSRFPATGFHQFTGLDGQGNTSFNWNKGPNRAEYRPGDIDPAWRNREDIRLVAYQLWFDTHHRLAEVNGERHLVHFLSPSIGSLFDEKDEFARYVCFNVFEALTEPGTWYLDRPTGRLYYLPLPGEDMMLTEIIAPRVTELVVFAGTAKAPVHDIRFEHVTFHHAEFDRAPEKPGFVQAAFDVPGAIRLTWSEDCVLYGCEIAHVGQYGVEIDVGCTNPVLAACTLHDLGAGGIRVGSEELKVHDSAIGKETALVRLEPIAATIIDCEIYDNGKRHPSSVGILLSNSGFHRVLHNHLHDLTYTGISSGWNWGYKLSRTVAVRIAHNHIHHVNIDRLLSDNGAIYTLGRHPGGSLVGNYIHDIGCYGYGGWGIYPDEGSSELDIRRNVVLRTKHAAFHMHYGRACMVRDNLFAASEDAHIKLSRGEQHRSLTFRDNVVIGSEGSWGNAILLPPEQLLWRNNVLFDARRPLMSPEQLVELQVDGQHRGTRIVDPLLRDPAGGDATPRADSPIKSIARTVRATHTAGVRRRRTLPHCFADYSVPVDAAFSIIETDVVPLGEPMRLADGSHRAVFRATIRNPGVLKARAALRFVARIGELSGPTHLDVRLAPGAERVMELALVVPAGERLAVLATKPFAGSAVAHQVFVLLGSGGQDVAVPRLPYVDISEVAQRLAELPIFATRFGPAGAVCAHLRLAVMGESVALHVSVKDARMHHGTPPWNGSCIEIFTAGVDGGETCAQITIQPEIPGTPLRTGLQRNGGFSQVYFPTENARTATGYVLSALIPLELLGVGSGVAFRMEVAITAARGPGAQAERSAWMHAGEAFRSGAGMARITVA